MSLPAKILADVLGIPVQKTTDRRRRMEQAVLTLARPLNGQNSTNRVRGVVARCQDIGRVATADPAMFEQFVTSTLQESSG